MTRFDYILAVLAGATYVLLISFLASTTMTWGDPISTDGYWGQSSTTAVAYMQTYHSIGVVLAGIPIALMIVWHYQARWLRATGIAALIGSSCMLFDQLRGAWLIYHYGMTLDTYHIVSGAIDIVKVGMILLLLTAILRRILIRRT